MANALGKYLHMMRGSMPLREFASKCGISHTHLDSIEKGIDPRTKKPVSITVETLRLIADGLNVDFQFLSKLAADGNEYSLLNRYIENHLSGVSYENFAKENGISPHIMEIIKEGHSANGEDHLGTDDLNTLAKALHVDPVYLFCLYDGYDPHRVTNVRIPEDDITKPSPVKRMPVRLLPLNLSLLGGEDSPIQESERDHMQKYRLLDHLGKEAVDAVLEVEHRRYMADQAKIGMEAATEIAPAVIYMVPRYLHPMSAGYGEPMSGNESEDMELCRKPPRGTSYVAPVSGDSMEPTYHDGDLLFIRAQEEIMPGQVGVFFMDGKQWIKEMGDGVLVSHNPGYGPRPMTEDIRCQGLVLGVCDDSYFA